MPVACVHHSQALGSTCSSQSFIWAGWPLPRCQAPCLLRGLLDTRLQPTEWIQLFSLQEQGQGRRPGVCIAIPYSWWEDFSERTLMRWAGAPSGYPVRTCVPTVVTWTSTEKVWGVRSRGRPWGTTRGETILQFMNRASIPLFFFVYISLMVSQVALVVRNLTSNAEVIRDAGSIHRSERSPRTRHGNPFLFLHLEKPMDWEYMMGHSLCDAECQTVV